jgi:hypothetical protein
LNGQQKCEENFNLLKELLTSAPILKIVDPNENFVVCTDACKEGLGGVLTQNGHVISYESLLHMYGKTDVVLRQYDKIGRTVIFYLFFLYFFQKIPTFIDYSTTWYLASDI